MPSRGGSKARDTRDQRVRIPWPSRITHSNGTTGSSGTESRWPYYRGREENKECKDFRIPSPWWILGSSRIWAPCKWVFLGMNPRIAYLCSAQNPKTSANLILQLKTQKESCMTCRYTGRWKKHRQSIRNLWTFSRLSWTRSKIYTIVKTLLAKTPQNRISLANHLIRPWLRRRTKAICHHRLYKNPRILGHQGP